MQLHYYEYEILFMRRLLRFLLIVSIILPGQLGATSPETVAKCSLGTFAIPGTTLGDVSPVFLSETLVAVLMRFGHSRHGTSRLILFKVAGEKIESIAQIDKPNEGDRLLSVGGNRVLLSAGPHSYLYSNDLKQQVEIPFRVFGGSFPRSNIIGEDRLQSWTIYRLGPPLVRFKAGPGELQSISDQVVVFRSENQVRIEAANGQLFGSFSVEPDTKGIRVAEAAGKGRLLLNIDGMFLADYGGIKFGRFPSFDGWGSRHGWSDDGGRMLLDRFTNPAGILTRAGQNLGAVLGMDTSEDFKGETVTVVESRSGNICAEFASADKLLGQRGSYHADLSPTGKLVVVATLDSLSLYRVPDACTDH